MNNSPSSSSSSTLLALTTAALATSALQPVAQAAVPVDRSTVSYRFSVYQEQDIDAAQVIAGDTGRYDIDIHQFRLLSPVGEQAEISLELAHEKMSGASPWYIGPGADNQPVQVMSGASIRDLRRDALLKGSYFLENSKFSVGWGVSEEDDYLAHNGLLEAELELNDKHTTLSGGLGFSRDTLNPTDADRFPGRVKQAEKDSLSLFLGVSQVINQRTVIQSSLSYTRLRGFLSDPYRLAFVAGDLLADSRPRRREQWAWLTRYRYYFPETAAALHLDYRLYHDSWQVTSHTLDIAWYQELPRGWTVTPGLRWYSQTDADFYQPFYTESRADGHYSSDYRLSEYGAISARLSIAWESGDWRLILSGERYLSDSSYALGDVAVENPGLLDFTTLTVGVDFRF